MRKLNPEDLTVSSFDTTPDAGDRLQPITLTTNDPTAQTYCFICPPITYDCW